MAQVQRIAPVCLPRRRLCAVAADMRENAAAMLYKCGQVRVKTGCVGYRHSLLCEICG